MSLIAAAREAAPTFDFALGEEVAFVVRARIIARTESTEREPAYLLEGELPWGYKFKRFIDDAYVVASDEVEGLPAYAALVPA